MPDGQCDYLSSQWGTYTGVPEHELLGLTWLERVLHPDDRERTLACWMAAVEDKGVYDLEYRIRRHDGQYHWFKTRGVPIRDGQGRIVKWFGTCTDIEDQKQAQEALARSEERFRQLADAMPQIVWTARPDGNIDYQNRRWREFTGLPETLGNEGWVQILHPDDAQPAQERWGASVRSGAPFEMEIRLLDRRRQSYRWHLIRTVAVHDESGGVARWFGTGTDIHEQKRAEESSRYLAEASAALAGVVDYESTLQKVVNLAVPYFADWSAVDVANEDGSTCRLAVAHRDADKIRLAHELMEEYPPDPNSPSGVFAVLRTGKPEIISDITDDLLVKGAKDERHLSLIRSLGLKSYICVPLIVSGNPLGVLTFATAESGRRYTDADLALAKDLAHRAAVAVENTRLYQALREADRRKDEFLATLAHELRNPLAPIRNSLQILKMPQARCGDGRAVTGHDGAPGPSSGPAGGRPPGRVACHAGQDRTPQGAGGTRHGGRPCGGDGPAARRGPGARVDDRPAARILAAGRRPGAARPGGRQPADERRQVYRGERPHLANGPTRRRRGGAAGAGHRHRHRPGHAAPHLRVVRAGGPRRHAGRRAGWASD